MADFLEAATTLSPTAEQSPMASSVIEATEEVIHPPLGIPEGPSATELLPEEGGWGNDAPTLDDAGLEIFVRHSPTLDSTYLLETL